MSTNGTDRTHEASRSTAAASCRNRSRIVSARDTRLDTIRREIDALDAELLELLNRRGRRALEVAAVKDCKAEPRYYRPERETALLRRLVAANGGPLSDEEVMRLFREIVSTCRALEQRLEIRCTTVGEGVRGNRPLRRRSRHSFRVECRGSARRDRGRSLRLRHDRVLPIGPCITGRRRPPRPWTFALRRVVRARRRAIRRDRARAGAAHGKTTGCRSSCRHKI